MDLYSVFVAIEDTGIAHWMRNAIYALPSMSVLHVIGLSMVFGTILVVDLRLIGLVSERRPFQMVSSEMLRWTWLAFAIAVVTGLFMFAANATTFYSNWPFRIKMLALALAGVNMLIFHFVTGRDAHNWQGETPQSGKVAGALSIALWLSVIVLGRWIGYTKGYNFDIPDDIVLDFDFL